MNLKSGAIERLESFVMYVRDVRASRAWFERAFGVTVGRVNDHSQLCVVEFEGGASLVMQQLRSGEHIPSLGSAMGYPVFRVRNADQFLHDLKGMGVQTGPIHDGAGRRWFTIRDLDDNRIDIVQLMREGDSMQTPSGGLSLA